VADELGEWRRSAFRTALTAREDVEAWFDGIQQHSWEVRDPAMLPVSGENEARSTFTAYRNLISTHFSSMIWQLPLSPDVTCTIYSPSARHTLHASSTHRSFSTMAPRNRFNLASSKPPTPAPITFDTLLERLKQSTSLELEFIAQLKTGLTTIAAGMQTESYNRSDALSELRKMLGEVRYNPQSHKIMI